MTLQDKIHKIKESRLTPTEKFLYDIFWNIKTYVSDEYPNSIFYKKDNDVLFEYDKKTEYFWCHYYKIWLVLKTEYGLNKQEIKDLIKGVVWEVLKLKDVTSQPIFRRPYNMVWETLKLKVDK